MSAPTATAPWKRPPTVEQPKALGDADLKRMIVACIEAHPGSALDDVLYATDMPEARPARERIQRLLDLLMTEAELDKWLDHNERPVLWRYWLRGDRPPVPAPREALRPRPSVSQVVVQEIVRDIPPAPVAPVRRETVSPPAPPRAPEPAAAAPTREEAEDDNEVYTPPSMRAPADGAPVTQQVLEYVEKHPGGVSSSDVERDVGRGASMRLTPLGATKRVARRGDRGSYRYFPMGPPDPEAPPTPRAAKKDAPRNVEPKAGGARKTSPNTFRKAKLAVQAEAKGKPGPKWKQEGKEPPSIRTQLRELAKKRGDKGLGSHEISDQFQRNGLTTAGHLVRIGEFRREGYGQGSRYFYVRGPVEGQEQKRHGPRAPVHDELERAVERVRKARADLQAAADELATVAARYGKVSA